MPSACCVVRLNHFSRVDLKSQYFFERKGGGDVIGHVVPERTTAPFVEGPGTGCGELVAIAKIRQRGVLSRGLDQTLLLDLVRFLLPIRIDSDSGQ